MPPRIRAHARRAASRRRPAAHVVALVLALAFLVGCSDAPKPSSTKAQSASPSASASPSRSTSADRPPTMPPAARGTSRRAAVPFTRFYVQVLNYAARSLDPSMIRRLSTRSCRQCSAIAKSVDQVRRRHGHFVGGQWTVREPQLLPQWRHGLAQVRTVVTYPKQLVYESQSARPMRFKAGKTLYKFDLVASKRGWRISNITGSS